MEEGGGEMEAPTFVSPYWVGETLLSNRLTKEKGGERSGRTVSPKKLFFVTKREQ